MTFKGFISIAFALVLLIGLLIVFPKPSGKTDDPEPSRLTGYPTWHGKIDGTLCIFLIFGRNNLHN